MPATIRNRRPPGLLRKREKPDPLNAAANPLMTYLPSRRQKSSEADATRQTLHHVRRRDDLRALDQVIRRDAAWRRAGAARPDLAAVADEGLHHIPQRLEAFLMNPLGVSLRGEPDTLDGQQDDDILIGGRGHIADDEGQRRALWIFSTVRAVNEQLSHGFFSLSI